MMVYAIIIDILLIALLAVLIKNTLETTLYPAFSKVSDIQYHLDMANFGWRTYMKLDNVRLPERKNKKSACHDIMSPVDVSIKPGETKVIPTGIRCKMNPNEIMMILPSTGSKDKKGIVSHNTTSIVEADYYESVNEGHIIVTLTNTTNKVIKIPKGSTLAKAVFSNFLKAKNFNVNKEDRFKKKGKV